ncbi:MAG TPA: cysteine desulfurase NifS [Bacillota bacterium]|jgi:cysteine desulfurase
MAEQRRVYLDHAATTPVLPEVVRMMDHYMLEAFGNPSSIHAFGREARKGVEEAREQIAALMGANPTEIIFTSGGTEADNLAIQGTARGRREFGNHIITSAIEHHAILHTCEYLEKEGFRVTYLPVDKYGMVDPEDVRKALTPQTILVTIMGANNEVGTIQPSAEIGRIVKEHSNAYYHIDAVQTYGNWPVSVDDLRVDFMSVSSHKIYGPKGCGALYQRKGVKLMPLVFGGSHERKRRAGTENVPGIVGFGKAAEIAKNTLDQRIAHNTSLRDRLISGLLAQIDYAQLNGHPVKRLPANANISVEYVEGESMLLNLDMKGVAASSGSACTSGSLEPSHVLLAMGLPHEVAHGSLRLTVGTDNSMEDIEYVIGTLPDIVRRLRSMSPLYADKIKGHAAAPLTPAEEEHHEDV